MNREPLSCLIVDDEPIARDIVAGYVDQLPGLNCVGQFKNAIEAMCFLENFEEDSLVFLDIKRRLIELEERNRLISGQKKRIENLENMNNTLESKVNNLNSEVLIFRENSKQQKKRAAGSRRRRQVAGRVRPVDEVPTPAGQSLRRLRLAV